MKKIIKSFFALLGIQVSRIAPPKSGIDKTDGFEMQKYLTPGPSEQLTIFDIGAYVGDVSLIYNRLFPQSKIFAFEPFPDSFQKLKQNTSTLANITIINKGMGDREGTSKFQSNTFAPTNSILKTHKSGEETWGKGLLDTIETVDIELTTIDSFVAAQGIKKIDILKLDVQGAEQLVLNGAKKSFEQGIIRMIFTEIITLPTYEGQPQFDETLKLARSYGFELYNLYNYSLTDSGQLRQVDAIFIKAPANNNTK